MPDHWHLICKRSADNGGTFEVHFIARDGFEDKEGDLMRASDYSVKFTSCNDSTCLGREPKGATP